jgi:hypothetical protein
LREQNIADLDVWLDADQRAELCMLRSMLELDFYFVIVYFRWQADAGWAGGSARNRRAPTRSSTPLLATRSSRA